MLFTWDTTNLCIVFSQWHIRSTTSLVFSLAAVVLLAMGYEALRSVSRRYEFAMKKRVESMPSKPPTLFVAKDPSVRDSPTQRLPSRAVYIVPLCAHI